MIQTFFNWLRLDAQNFIVEVWWCALILWIALLAISITDVASAPLSRGAKAAWIFTILLVPAVGLAAYCVFCLMRADYYMLEFLFRRRKRPRRSQSKSSAS